MTHGDIARSGFGPRTGIALSNGATSPFSIAAQLEKMDALKTRSEYLIPPVAIPVQDVKTMHDAHILPADVLAFPLSRTVKDERSRLAIIGRFRSSAGQSGVDHHELAAAVDIGRPQPVRGTEPVDFGHIPGPAWIPMMPQNGDDSHAVFCLV